MASSEPLPVANGLSAGRQATPGHMIVEKLGVRYERNQETIQALEDINLAVNEGEFVTIVGPSGCGKTTLLRVVAGLVKPSEGTVRLDGTVVTRPSSDRALVFQSDRLLPWRTVLDNVVLSLEVTGTAKRKAREIARGYTNLVGLKDFETRYPSELSGGMRQRVNLARSLAVDPRLLLMDEPFANLDALTRDHMQQELLRIWRATRKTVLFITHNVDEAVFLSDRVYVFSARPGRVAADVVVNLPRPRTLDVKGSPEFAALVTQVYGVLRAIWKFEPE